MATPSSDGGFASAVISIRIVDIDYYMMPLDKFSHSVAYQAARLTLPGLAGVSKLPTVRIFGCTPAGQKACLHLHGAAPYFYVELPSCIAPCEASKFAEELRYSLEAALRASYAHEDTGAESSTAVSTSAQALISSVEPTPRTSIYGFHPYPTVFLRISAFNPRTVSRAASILHAGGGLPSSYTGLRLQPFEAHLPFVLQVLTDLSLVGMGFINLSACKFRAPLPHAPPACTSNQANSLSSPAQSRIFTTEVVRDRPELMWDFAATRRSNCDLELDAFVGDVLNPEAGAKSPCGAQGAGPDSYAVKTLRVLWDEERRRAGKQPPVPVDGPRFVHAGPGLTSQRLEAKLRHLIHTANAEAVPAENTSAASAGSDGSQFAELVDLLNRPILTTPELGGSANSAALPAHDAEQGSDTSDDEREDAAPDDEWSAIYDCSQSGVLPVAQGDGTAPGDDDDIQEHQGSTRTRLDRGERSPKPTSRRRLGGVRPLSIVDLPPSHRARSHDVRGERSRQPVSAAYNPHNRITGAPVSRKRQRDHAVLSIESKSRPGSATANNDEIEQDTTRRRLTFDIPTQHVSDQTQGFAQTTSLGRTDPQPLGPQNASAFGFQTTGQLSRLLVRNAGARAPSARQVMADFGSAKQPSLVHAQAFCSEFSDLDRKPKVYAGVVRHLQHGGVRGLRRATRKFVKDRLAVVDELSIRLFPVRNAPSVLEVVMDCARGTRQRHDGKRKARFRIDSAGREVAVYSGLGSSGAAQSPSAWLSTPAEQEPRRRLRRRNDACQDDAGSSEESEDAKETPSRSARNNESPIRSAAERPTPEAAPSSPAYDDRSFYPETPAVGPSSPKYDDRSFYPETPEARRMLPRSASSRRRGRRSRLSGTNSPAIPLLSSTPSQSTNAPLHGPTSQNLTIVILEVRILRGSVFPPSSQRTRYCSNDEHTRPFPTQSVVFAVD